MTPGTVYVTMLRNPATQLETTFHNLRFADLLGVEDADDPLGTFITNPKVYIQNVIKRKKFKVSIFYLLMKLKLVLLAAICFHSLSCANVLPYIIVPYVNFVYLFFLSGFSKSHQEWDVL